MNICVPFSSIKPSPSEQTCCIVGGFRYEDELDHYTRRSQEHVFVVLEWNVLIVYVAMSGSGDAIHIYFVVGRHR